jgi:hypothetical protein
MDQEHIDFRNFNLAHIRQYLRDTDFPAPREEILDDMRKAGATDVELDVAGNLPDRLYHQRDEVLRVLNDLAGLLQGSAQSNDHIRSGGKTHSDGPFETGARSEARRRSDRSRNEFIEEDPVENERPGHIPRLRHRQDGHDPSEQG